MNIYCRSIHHLYQIVYILYLGVHFPPLMMLLCRHSNPHPLCIFLKQFTFNLFLSFRVLLQCFLLALWHCMCSKLISCFICFCWRLFCTTLDDTLLSFPATIFLSSHQQHASIQLSANNQAVQCWLPACGCLSVSSLHCSCACIYYIRPTDTGYVAVYSYSCILILSLMFSRQIPTSLNNWQKSALHKKRLEAEDRRLLLQQKWHSRSP